MGKTFVKIKNMKFWLDSVGKVRFLKPLVNWLFLLMKKRCRILGMM